MLTLSEGSHGVRWSLHWDLSRNLNIIFVLPVGTASVERSVSYMKLIKTRVHNSNTDQNLGRLMRIAFEGPELSAVNFNGVLTFLNKNNRRILL